MFKHHINDDRVQMPVGGGKPPTLYGSLKTEDCFKRDLKLLTVPEVADLLKVSAPSVRRLQQRRCLPFIKVGGSVRFSIDDIMSYLAKQRIEAVE